MTRRDDHPQAPSGRTGKGSRHAWAAIALAAIATLAAAVGAGAQDPSGASPGASTGITLTDDDGTLVTLPAEPQRVVSLSPATTETVFALGAGARLVGGTDADDYPSEAAALPDVVSSTKVLLERIVDLGPDLILAGGNGLTPQGDIDQLRSLGYPVVAVYAETVDGVLEDVRLVGAALGGPAVPAADGLTRDMDASIDGIAALGATAGSMPRTLYELDFFEGQLYGPAPDSFVADLVDLAGGEAITTSDPTVFSIPVEQLVLADPQVIVLGDAAYGVCPDVVAARPGWAGITAVREGAIRPVNDTVITRPGPRLAEGLASLTRAVHPELADELSDFPADPPMCRPAGGSPAPSTGQP